MLSVFFFFLKLYERIMIVINYDRYNKANS